MNRMKLPARSQIGSSRGLGSRITSAPGQQLQQALMNFGLRKGQFQGAPEQVAPREFGPLPANAVPMSKNPADRAQSINPRLLPSGGRMRPTASVNGSPMNQIPQSMNPYFKR